MLYTPRAKRLENFIIILLGAITALQLFSAASYNLSAVQIKAELSLFGRGQTSFIINPFGEIRARTHSLPLHLILSLESIDLEQLEEVVVGQKPQELLQQIIVTEGRPILYSYILRTLLLGGIGGGVANFFWSREKRAFLEGLLIGFLLISALLLSVYSSYDMGAFTDPEFVGMLKAAPWMMSLVEEGLKNIHALGDQMRTIAQNLEDIFASINAQEPTGIFQSHRRILHVSDIHNNPVAFPFIQEIISTFQVEMVIDTGDLTDYGTALEAEIAASIANLPVPYIFVPGNHDSPAVISYLQQLNNVTVLEGGSINRGGIRITGLKDPSSEGREVGVADAHQLADYQEGLLTLISQLEGIPDIVAVHDIRLAEPLIGRIPVILHGHTHTPKMIQKQGTTIIDAGTTGAAGIRGLEGKTEIPYSLALLHFREDAAGYTLMAVDLIRIRSRGGGFHLERLAVDP